MYREYQAECVFTYLSVLCIHSLRRQFTGSAGYTFKPFGEGCFINCNKSCGPAISYSSLTAPVAVLYYSFLPRSTDGFNVLSLEKL